MNNIAKCLDRIVFTITHSEVGWIAAFAAWFIPLKDTFILVLAIVFADLLTGLLASRKKKIPCSSRRLRDSIGKLLCYVGLLMLFYQFESAVGIQEWIATYKLIAGFIFITEIISILENMAVITNNQVFIRIIRLIRGRASRDEKTGTIVDDIIKEKNDEKE